MSRAFETSGLRTLRMGLVLGMTSMAVPHVDAAVVSVEAAKKWLALQQNPVQVSVLSENSEYTPSGDRCRWFHCFNFSRDVADVASPLFQQFTSFQFVGRGSKASEKMHHECGVNIASAHTQFLSLHHSSKIFIGEITPLISFHLLHIVESRAGPLA